MLTQNTAFNYLVIMNEFADSTRVYLQLKLQECVNIFFVDVNCDLDVIL